MERLKLYQPIINPGSMKVRQVKAARLVFIILGWAAVILLAANGIESEGLTITGSARPISGSLNTDPQSMEQKVAELQRGPVTSGLQANERRGTYFEIGIDPAQSNGKVHNLSKLINLSSNNSTNFTARNASIVNTKTLNWTALNTTVLNATSLNTTAINASDPEGGSKNYVTSYLSGTGPSISGSTAVGPEGASSSYQSSLKGSHNYSSSQGGLGKSKIKSSMSLEGDFEVQRSSSY